MQSARPDHQASHELLTRDGRGVCVSGLAPAGEAPVAVPVAERPASQRCRTTAPLICLLDQELTITMT